MDKAYAFKRFMNGKMRMINAKAILAIVQLAGVGGAGGVLFCLFCVALLVRFVTNWRVYFYVQLGRAFVCLTAVSLSTCYART